MKALANSVKNLLGVTLTQEQISKLQVYENELLEWNKRINLTAIRDAESIRIKHFLDSLTVPLAWERQAPPARIIDVGTGAGFPGLILKLIWPTSQVTLVESVHKKADFCQHIVEQLNFKHVTIIPERVEKIGQDPDHRQSYNLAVARAVARMPILMEYLLPLVHRNGIVMAMKGESAPAETQAAEKAIHLMGGKLHKLIKIELPKVVEERFIVVIDKVARTPEEYPRRVGVPTKNPIQ
jgi:16S rRNA (guanine527-N7)-methyltransferase